MTATLSPPRSPALRLETFTSFDDAEAIAPQWDALVTRLDGSLYMTFSWCQVWWRHYGGDRELRLIVIHVDEEMVGVLPFFIDSLRIPLGTTRVGKLVGSDSVIALVDAPVIPDMADEAVALAMKRLFVDDRADMVHVGPSSYGEPAITAICRSGSTIDGIARIIRDREAGSHTVFELPEGFDTYVKSLSKNHRSNYRRNLNKLQRTFKFEVDVVHDAGAVEREFEAFVEMHQAQWQAVNKLGHFDDWPGSREFSRDLVRALASADGVRLIRLLADDQVVAYYWCFAMNRVYYWRLPARVIGKEWDRFALGRVGLMKMMEVAASEGAIEIEAGSGRYEYKEQLNARSRPLRSVTLCRRGLGPRLRALLTLAMGDLLDLVYYRLWYIRLAPHVETLRGPLWRSWIRRRF